MDPLLKTERTDLYIQRPQFADLLISYYQSNAAFLSPWEPKRDESYFSRRSFIERLEASEKNFINDSSVQFIAIHNETGRTVGVCNFTGIVRGPFQACYLGYSLAGEYEGKGYMFEILSAAIAYMFEDKGLHRIMANYMPRNEKSGRLLDKLGFEREGMAKEYLQINGKWEDHILTSLISNKSL